MRSSNRCFLQVPFVLITPCLEDLYLSCWVGRKLQRANGLWHLRMTLTNNANALVVDIIVIQKTPLFSCCCKKPIYCGLQHLRVDHSDDDNLIWKKIISKEVILMSKYLDIVSEFPIVTHDFSISYRAPDPTYILNSPTVQQL